jgi:Mg2+ and Co2+ transporter CorA
MPEYKWRYGYLFFWILFFITLGVSLWWLKRKERIKIAGPIKESNVKK